MGRFLRSLVLMALLVLAGVSASAQDADRILGVYKVVGETTGELSHVRIYRNGDKYDGRIIWLEHPNNADGTKRLDAMNPNPALRALPADEILILDGLHYDAKKEQWIGGTIYNPVDGKVYDVLAEFENDEVLRVRGYVGSPMFGKTYLWDRLE